MKSKLPPIKVFHARCLPLCLATLVAGILFAAVDMWWVTILLDVAAAIVIVVLTLRAKKRRGVGMACLVCLVLSLSTLLWMQSVRTGLADASSTCAVTGRIVSATVDEDGRVSAIVLDDMWIDGTPYEGRVDVALTKNADAPMGYVYADAYGSEYVVGVPLSIGQTVQVEGSLSPVDARYFDSRSMHAVVRGKYYSLSATACRVEDVPLRRTAAEAVRCALYRTLRRNMCGQSAGFAYAFLTGDSSFVPQDVLSGYRASGTGHLLAVSGLHVGILAAVLLWLFKRCKLPPWARTVALAAVLGIYAWLCSATPSVLRASIVAVTVSLATTLGAHRDKPSMLALAGLVLLAVNPLWLFDVSFLLSFAAFAGVVLLYPPLRALCRKVPARVGDALALNMAVTVSTLPLTVYFFGGFSALSVPFNFLLIPVMSTVYPLLLLFAVMSAVPALGILLTLLDYVLRVVTDIVVLVGGTGYVKCRMSIGQLPLWYGAMALLSPYCLLRKVPRYAAASALALSTVLWAVLAQVL